MRKNKALPEDKKLQIAKLYDKGELSIGAIADNLGVSLRSVHNYKDHMVELPSEPIIAKKEPSYNFEKHCWEPKTPGYTVEPERELGKSDKPLDSNKETLSEDDHVEEPETINFVGGKKFKTEEPEKEEFEYQCEKCGHEFNEELSNCPGCGIPFDWEGNSENKESIDLGKIVLALGGIVTVGYLIHRARNNNQNWSQQPWNNQGAPLIDRLFNNQNQVI